MNRITTKDDLLKVCLAILEVMRKKVGSGSDTVDTDIEEIFNTLSFRYPDKAVLQRALSFMGGMGILKPAGIDVLGRFRFLGGRGEGLGWEIMHKNQPFPQELLDDFAYDSTSPVGNILKTLSNASDRYTFVEKIGFGGVAKVYKYRDTTLNRDVAVKFMDVAADNVIIHAQTLATLEHENVIKLYDVIKLDHPEYQELRPCVTMALIRGVQLDKTLEQENIPWKDILSLGSGLISGMQEIHRHNLKHGDFQECNVLVENNKPVIIDVANYDDFATYSVMRVEAVFAKDIDNLKRILFRLLQHSDLDSSYVLSQGDRFKGVVSLHELRQLFESIIESREGRGLDTQKGAATPYLHISCGFESLSGVVGGEQKLRLKLANLGPVGLGIEVKAELPELNCSVEKTYLPLSADMRVEIKANMQYGKEYTLKVTYKDEYERDYLLLHIFTMHNVKGYQKVSDTLYHISPSRIRKKIVGE